MVNYEDWIHGKGSYQLQEKHVDYVKNIERVAKLPFKQIKKTAGSNLIDSKMDGLSYAIGKPTSFIIKEDNVWKIKYYFPFIVNNPTSEDRELGIDEYSNLIVNGQQEFLTNFYKKGMDNISAYPRKVVKTLNERIVKAKTTRLLYFRCESYKETEQEAKTDQNHYQLSLVDTVWNKNKTRSFRTQYYVGEDLWRSNIRKDNTT